jgi:hypothetical protein
MEQECRHESMTQNSRETNFHGHILESLDVIGSMDIDSDTSKTVTSATDIVSVECFALTFAATPLRLVRHYLPQDQNRMVQVVLQYDSNPRQNGWILFGASGVVVFSQNWGLVTTANALVNVSALVPPGDYMFLIY